MRSGSQSKAEHFPKMFNISLKIVFMIYPLKEIYRKLYSYDMKLLWRKDIFSHIFASTCNLVSHQNNVFLVFKRSFISWQMFWEKIQNLEIESKKR